MRIGEVLKLKHMDIAGRKAVMRGSKSGKEAEAVFLPQTKADRQPVKFQVAPPLIVAGKSDTKVRHIGEAFEIRDKPFD